MPGTLLITNDTKLSNTQVFFGRNLHINDNNYLKQVIIVKFKNAMMEQIIGRMLAHAKGGEQFGWLRKALKMGSLFPSEWKFIKSQDEGRGWRFQQWN